MLTDHAQQSKRAVATDLMRLMRMLGHTRFAAVGHDRGCYVVCRAALDFPEQISKLVVMDAVPISEALARCDAKLAQKWFHWFFFAQPDRPEQAILADPDGWYRGSPEAMGVENYREFRQATHDPATITAMLEDYRAGVSVDREHEQADWHAGRKVRCPTLFLWSTRDDMEDLYGDPVAVWQPWVDDLQAASIDSGHHMAKENPTALATALTGFLTR